MNTRWFAMVGFVAVLFLFVLVMQKDTAAAQAPAKQKGFCYATWQAGQYSEPDADLSLAHLAATGIEWLGLVVTRYQENITSTTIITTEATPTDADLIHVITQAHALGLKVMLKPHVDLSNDPTHWRGQIGEAFTSEAQWAAWFSAYRNTIEHYAELAQAQGVEQFCLGTELVGTTDRESDWRAVVAGVRAHYSGFILYEANHSGEELAVTWWDAVDYIGISGYYPLTDKDDPTLAELKAGWERQLSTLAALSARWNKLILFPEIGYRSQDGANRHPWEWETTGTVDLQEQALAYQAAFESLYNQPWFGGMFWWVWSPDPFDGGPCDDGFTPHDKPAEDVLRSWYGASPRTDTRPLFAPQPNYSKTLTIYSDGLATGWEDWSWLATLDFAATSRVYNGTRAISVTLDPWGALSLWHPAFDTGNYYWLEFYVCGAPLGQQHLWAFFHDQNDQELRKRRVDDCRYIPSGIVDGSSWQHLLIPLEDLNAANKSTVRVCLQDRAGEGASFWVDEIRLVEAVWRVYLPLLMRD